jgi:hypothetical protein
MKKYVYMEKLKKYAKIFADIPAPLKQSSE